MKARGLYWDKNKLNSICNCFFMAPCIKWSLNYSLWVTT